MAFIDRWSSMVLLIFIGAAVPCHAALTNLVNVSEFEDQSPAGDFQNFSSIDSQWTTSSGNGFEYWVQGFNSSPANGSDGAASGNSIELRGSSGTGTMTLTVTIPNNVEVGSQATLSFDAWNRGATQDTGRYEIFVNAVSQGISVADTASGVWTANSTSFNVAAGDTVAVLFSDTSPSSGARGLHFDDVQVVANLIPEPGIFGTILMGMMWFFSSRRKR